MNKNILHTIIIPLLGIISTPLHAAVPWLNEAGDQSLSVSLVNDQFDRVWEGTNEGDISKIVQRNYLIDYTYGFTDQLMLSVNMGYTNTTKSGNVNEFSGLTDTNFALSYQINNEFYDNIPLSAAIQLTGIIKGTYDRAYAGNPHAPGNKANGTGISLQVGKFLSDNFAIFSDIGFQKFADGVPDNLLFSAGGYLSMTSAISFSVQFSSRTALSGTDIKGPGFSPTLFHQTKEEKNWIDTNVNYSFLGNQSAGLGYAHVISGRNAGKSRILYGTYQYSF